MKASSKENSSRWTKTNLVVFYVLLLLSVDEINPVKILLHVFPSLRPWHCATICIIIMIYIFISDLKAMLYFFVKIFFHSILSIFFRSVDILGRENVPPHGPVIFTINHANQFMDAVMVVCSSSLPVSYLMAEASFQRRVIGDLAWALGVVPVRRAQDSAKPGSGRIQMKQPMPAPKTDENIDKSDQKQENEIDNNSGGEQTTATTRPKTEGTDDKTKDDNEQEKHEVVVQEEKKIIVVTGFGTKFTEELVPGDKIRPPGTAFGLKVKSIESDTRMIIDGTGLPSDFPMDLFDTTTSSTSDSGNESVNGTNNKTIVTYDFMKRTPLNKVFEKVLDRLAGGGAVGIFPEGGSHDRTDLLPLKVGISLIAYSALEKDGINVPVVPVGLSYFRAHRWRGKAVVEYGRPIAIDTKTLADFKAGGDARRKVCNEFLDRVEDAMRSVIVSAPDYETLELIHTARRLYQRKKGPLDSIEKQDLSRRFVEGYKRLLQIHDGRVPREWLDLQQRIMAYRNELKDLGLKDYQVMSLTEEHLDEMDVSHVDADHVLTGLQVTYHVIHFLVIICVAAVPALLLNAPVGIMAGLYSESRRKKALAASKVKIRGFDVMLTEKVLFCVVMVPTLWITYGLLLITLTDLDGPTIALIMGILPLFAYTGIIVADAGMVDWLDFRPYWMRLFPSTRRRLAALPQTRKQLKDDLRLFVKTMGPALGEVYYGKKVDWPTEISRIESTPRLDDVEAKKTK